MAEEESYVQSVLESVLCQSDGELIFPDKTNVTTCRIGQKEISTIKKRHFHTLTLETKIQVLRDTEAGISHRNLAVKYNCGKTQIGNIIKQKEELLKEWATSTNRNRKRKRSEPYEEVNNMVWEWYQEAKKKDLPLNGPILQAKAKEYASLLEIPSFTASNGWLDSFRRRHDISFRRAGNKENNTCSKISEWKSHIASILKEYSPKDIYNIHETGLLFRTIPSESLLNKNKSSEDNDLINECLSITLCCNAIGEKEGLLIVSNHFKPWYLKEIDTLKLGIKWHCNERAWLTEDIFKEFLQELNEKMKNECRKIVLFTSDITCHLSTIELSHVSVKLLPSYSTAFSQPLDMGIINSFKLLYRKKLLKTLVARINNNTNIIEVAKKINIVQAIKWVVTSWAEVKPEVIMKCFKTSGIICEGKSHSFTVDDFDADFIRLCELAGISSISEDIRCFNSFVNDMEVNLLPKALSFPNIDDANINIQPVEDEHGDNESHDFSLENTLKNLFQLRKVLHRYSVANDQAKLFDAVDCVESELENIIVKQKLDDALLQNS